MRPRRADKRDPKALTVAGFTPIEPGHCDGPRRCEHVRASFSLVENVQFPVRQATERGVFLGALEVGSRVAGAGERRVPVPITGPVWSSGSMGGVEKRAWI